MRNHNKTKTALITGISGQDGLYMAELLLKMGYQIFGTSRNINQAAKCIPREILDSIKLIEWDLDNFSRICSIIEFCNPTEIYNFAALSSGELMHKNPAAIGLINGLAVTKILSAVTEINPKIRFCQASSSEMFGIPVDFPQTESTPFRPKNPYGAAKLYAHQMVNIYRENCNIYSCSAILYNHESPRRKLNFVTRKITHTAAKIKLGLEKNLILGNLDIKRDWSFAGDAIIGMWMMLQTTQPSDYIVASGVSRSIREFCQTAFQYLNMNYEEYVISSPDFFRPSDSTNLEGNPEKLKKLGWRASMNFEELVKHMIDSDLASLQNLL